MENVNTLDIDGTQWEITDAQARQEISVLKTNSEKKIEEINTKLEEKADKNYVDNNFATIDEVVESNITETSFINDSNLICKQGKVCTASIVYMLLDKNYNQGDVIGVIKDPNFFPRRYIRAPIIQLSSGISAEIIFKENGEITVGQAGSLTVGYWVGNFSWISK